MLQPVAGGSQPDDGWQEQGLRPESPRSCSLLAVIRALSGRLALPGSLALGVPR